MDRMQGNMQRYIKCLNYNRSYNVYRLNKSLPRFYLFNRIRENLNGREHPQPKLIE